MPLIALHFGTQMDHRDPPIAGLLLLQEWFEFSFSFLFLLAYETENCNIKYHTMEEIHDRSTQNLLLLLTHIRFLTHFTSNSSSIPAICECNAQSCEFNCVSLHDSLQPSFLRVIWYYLLSVTLRRQLQHYTDQLLLLITTILPISTNVQSGFD